MDSHCRSITVTEQLQCISEGCKLSRDTSTGLQVSQAKEVIRTKELLSLLLVFTALFDGVNAEDGVGSDKCTNQRSSRINPVAPPSILHED